MGAPELRNNTARAEAAEGAEAWAGLFEEHFQKQQDAIISYLDKRSPVTFWGS